MLLNLLYVFLFILLLQVLFFIYAVINKTDKVTDLSYGLTFIFGGAFALFLNWENISLFKILLFSLIAIWGFRLAIYLFIRILRTGKDKRFDGIREEWKRFGSFWLLQAVSVFIILLPATYTFLYPYETSLNTISVLGFIVAFIGILIEGVADYQKFVFKNKTENKNKWIATGLWKYSRHPNYLGEIMMWKGVFVYALVYLNDPALLTIISPLFITYLLTKVSGIPTLEKEYEKRYADDRTYQEYKKKTGVLFPKVI